MPKDLAELVVHLDGCHSHGVADPRALDAHVVAIAHFPLVVAAELLAQKSGDVVGLDRVNGGANQIPIYRLQIGLPAEHDVGGVLSLVQAPVIRFLDLLQDGTVSLGEFVQLAM